MPETNTLLNIGDPAPDFSLADVGGTTYHLSMALVAGPVLLVFFRSTFSGGLVDRLGI